MLGVASFLITISNAPLKQDVACTGSFPSLFCQSPYSPLSELERSHCDQQLIQKEDLLRSTHPTLGCPHPNYSCRAATCAPLPLAEDDGLLSRPSHCHSSLSNRVPSPSGMSHYCLCCHAFKFGCEACPSQVRCGNSLRHLVCGDRSQRHGDVRCWCTQRL